MSPEQISLLTSLVAVIKMLSNWPFAIFAAILIIGPWLLAVMLAYKDRQRFEAVVTMYEKNVELVHDYHDLAKNLRDVVMINTQTFTTLSEAIKSNQFCPVVREKGGTK